jgi:hypothetical protein
MDFMRHNHPVTNTGEPSKVSNAISQLSSFHIPSFAFFPYQTTFRLNITRKKAICIAVLASRLRFHCDSFVLALVSRYLIEYP